MRRIFCICLWLMTSVSASLLALPTVVQDPSRCFKDLQTNFFREDIVYEGLSFYQIPQGLWSPIFQGLQVRSDSVSARMKKKTAFMVPNPIEYPMNREAAVSILKSVLYEIFMETMNDYQANEQPTAAYIFEFIFSKRLPELKACFGEEVEQMTPKFQN